jgi:WD40 repeat protein
VALRWRQAHFYGGRRPSRKPFAGHDKTVRSAVFSPDGRRVVTASDDGTARLWDAETGKELATLAGHETSVTSATFNPDGRRVVTASNDKTSGLWEVFPTTQSLVDRAKAIVLRCLTPEQRSSFYLSPDPPGWCYTMKKWPYHDKEPPLSWYAQAWSRARDWITARFDELRGKRGLRRRPDSSSPSGKPLACSAEINCWAPRGSGGHGTSLSRRLITPFWYHRRRGLHSHRLDVVKWRIK